MLSNNRSWMQDEEKSENKIKSMCDFINQFHFILSFCFSISDFQNKKNESCVFQNQIILSK
jgi:hypothetical protein